MTLAQALAFLEKRMRESAKLHYTCFTPAEAERLRACLAAQVPGRELPHEPNA